MLCRFVFPEPSGVTRALTYASLASAHLAALGPVEVEKYAELWHAIRQGGPFTKRVRQLPSRNGSMFRVSIARRASALGVPHLDVLRMEISLRRRTFSSGINLYPEILN